MDFEKMTVEELTERRAAIAIEIEADGADLDALEAEVRAINGEMEKRRAAEVKRAAVRGVIADGAGTVVERKTKEVEIMPVKTVDEIRNSAEYINAYADYIRTGNPEQCRALLSENATGGTVAVPEIVYDITKTAWEREGIMSRVRKAYLRGNLKVGFEISATGATVHQEGVSVNEETLVLGVVELVPTAIKKWVSLSDEVLDLRGEAFLRYIYDELTYQIAKKAADELIAKIEAAGTVSTTTAPGVPVITAASIALGTVADAIAHLSDEAQNPVVIMNKLTWGAIKAAQYGASYPVDPFEGCDVIFNNTVTAFSAASTGDTYMIVGDLDHGALANFPNGDEITFKYDDLTLAASDLVRVIGREFVALGVVAPNAFVKVTK